MKKKLYSLIIFCFSASFLFSQTIYKRFFGLTGKDQTWTVPDKVNEVLIKAWGAGGAGGDYVFNDIGGGGGFATGKIFVTPGEKLTVIVGAGGLPGAGPGAYGGGGGKACGVGGRGGGRSAVINGAGIEILSAGAGGGGGGVAQANEVGGHGGGGLSGEPDNWLPYGGGAGTQTNAGAGGVSAANGNCPCGSNPGIGHDGGYAGCYDNGYNGSGGGGYYGGGSGTDLGDGAGGGGSSFTPAGGTTIAATSRIPPNISDTDYRYPAAFGGRKGKAGRCGLVVFIYTANDRISISKNELVITGNALNTTNSKINILPNPVKDIASVVYYPSQNGRHILSVTDALGNNFFNKEFIASANKKITVAIETRLYKPGIYYVAVVDNRRKKITAVFIKQ